MNIYVASETEIWRLSALCLSTPWVFGTLPGTGCGVLGKSLSLSGAWIYPSVQWRKSDLVKFLGFPWQCKHCSLWVFSLLSFSLVSFSGLHLLPSLDSLFPFFISSLLPAPPLVCFSLVLLLGQSDCQWAVALTARWSAPAEICHGHQGLGQFLLPQRLQWYWAFVALAVR